MRDDYDDDYDDDRGPSRRGVPFPSSIRFAGITWIIFGCLILLNGSVQLIMSLARAGQAQGAEAGGQAVGGVCGVVLVVLFGAAFLFVGIQSIQGTAKDTLGNAIGSIVFALLAGGGGAVTFIAGLAAHNLGANGPMITVLMIAGAVYMLCALGLLAAGVMALTGRQDYKDWRRANRRN